MPYGPTYTAIQAKTGSTYYRLQILTDGKVQVAKSTDSGASWTTVKTL